MHERRQLSCSSLLPLYEFQISFCNFTLLPETYRIFQEFLFVLARLLQPPSRSRKEKATRTGTSGRPRSQENSEEKSQNATRSTRESGAAPHTTTSARNKYFSLYGLFRCAETQFQSGKVFGSHCLPQSNGRGERNKAPP
jgi:hypothetical protein